uniref:Uncharacterized protein n=1 Tax=Tanacetum cinerariifolium TaxID=118510 RepID=A0A699H3X5_TANCI|nr:hypothetical protein [Tanacetum cinerariifolium]
MDYKQTKAYLPRIHRSRQMDEDLRESYCHLEGLLFCEGRFVTLSFIEANNMLLSFCAIDISRNPTKEKGKRVAFPSACSSSSSSSGDSEAPSFLEFYKELPNNENLTNVQREKRGMFKCLNHYSGTIPKYLKKQK